MQTLQTARLTTRPLPLPYSFTNSIQERLRDRTPTRPVTHAPGILRQRVKHKTVEKKKVVVTNPRTNAVIANFFASQGIALDQVKNFAFTELIRFLNPDAILPPEEDIAKAMEKQSTNTKLGINFQKTVGPVSVTIDLARQEDAMFMVFSIHYFEDLMPRKSSIFIRKLLLIEVDGSSILNTIRRAVSISHYADVKFSNIVVPSEEVYAALRNTQVSKRVYMCCFAYMTKFITDVLEIEEFVEGLQDLRNFICFIRDDPDHYGKFRRMQLAKSGDLEVPTLDDNTWCSTAWFLTKCLVFHDTFNEFVDRHRYNNYISAMTFNHLVYLQRLMHQCIKYCRDMSSDGSAISQVVAVYNGLKSYLTANSMGYHYQSHIRKLVDAAFKDVNDAGYERRLNVATYLDPRYAHRDSIYPSPKWKIIEEWVIQEFLECDDSLKKSYAFDLNTYEPRELREHIRQELTYYRTVSFVERPEESECPFQWWGSRQLHFSILSVMAREFLACPAVSVEAAQYFSAQGGKFDYIAEQYVTEKTQPYLSVAGYGEKFRGRGATDFKITQSMVESLNSISTRLQKMVHFDLYTHHLSATAEERNRIVTSQFPPMPTISHLNNHRVYLPPTETKPEIQGMTVIKAPAQSDKALLPRVFVRPVHFNGKSLAPALPIRQVETSSRIIHEQKQIRGRLPPNFQLQPLPPLPQPKVISLGPPYQLTRTIDPKTGLVVLRASMNVSAEEAQKQIRLKAKQQHDQERLEDVRKHQQQLLQPQKKQDSEEQKPVEEKEIKEEVVEPDLEKVKDEPLDEDEVAAKQKVQPGQQEEDPKPGDFLNSSPQAAPKPPVMMKSPPLTALPTPQCLVAPRFQGAKVQIDRPNGTTTRMNVAPHNFVQKFMGKQKFVPKYPVKIASVLMPPPISIRAPIPKPPGMSNQFYVNPMKVQVRRETEQKPQLQNNGILDDFKEEPLDDFTSDFLNFNLPPPPPQQFFRPPTTIYTAPLNEQTAKEAFERHRMNMDENRRKPCNRRCAVCGSLEQHDLLKNVTIDHEKLLIMLACVYRGEFSLAQAQDFMNRDTKTYICRIHFGETLEELDLMLKLNEGEDVTLASSDSIYNIMITVRQLRPHVTVPGFRTILNEFVDRNNHLRCPRTRIRNENRFDDFFGPVKRNEQNDTTDETIMPKEYRQPRKQVLEKDRQGDTVKIIEQEQLIIPPLDPNEVVDCANTVACVYCTVRGERTSMLKVPRSEERLARWIEKLGPEFEKRLIASGEESLICRSHFPEDAFSARGRLLKGQIPCSAPAKVVSTYQIHGNDFLKIREKRLGTDKTARVILDDNPNPVNWLEQDGNYTSDEEVPILPHERISTGKRRGRPPKSEAAKKESAAKAASLMEARKAAAAKKAVKAARQASGVHFMEEDDDPITEDDNEEYFYDSEFDDFDVPHPREFLPGVLAAINTSQNRTPEAEIPTRKDPDYVPGSKPQVSSDKTQRKRGRPRKYQSDDEEEPTFRRPSQPSSIPTESYGLQSHEQAPQLQEVKEEPQEEFVEAKQEPPQAVGDLQEIKEEVPEAAPELEEVKQEAEDEDPSTSATSTVRCSARTSKRTNKYDIDQDYDVMSEKKKRVARHNLRVNGKFAKQD